MRFAGLTDRLAGLGAEKWAVHLEGRRRAAAGTAHTFLSIGEPDLPPPSAVIDAAVGALGAGRVRYSGGQGEPTLLRAVAAHLTRRSGLAVGVDQVAAVAGTQHGLFTAMLTLAEHGDEVLVGDPCYATYEGIVAASGASMVTVPTRPDNGFHLTAEALAAAVTPRSRVVLLNSPGNPTGAVLTADELDAIGEVCRRHDLWILSDEVYAALTFAGPFVSPFDRPQLRDRTVVVASISKSHALPGLRGGWVAGPTTFVRRATSLLESMTFGLQPFVADAVACALDEHHPEVDAVREAFRRRADAVVAALRGSSAVHARLPEGGMFVMVDVRPTGLSGDAFARRLLDEECVVVMPGESFGPGGAGHLRVALTVADDELVGACHRLRALAERVVAERSTARG